VSGSRWTAESTISHRPVRLDHGAASNSAVMVFGLTSLIVPQLGGPAAAGRDLPGDSFALSPSTRTKIRESETFSKNPETWEAQSLSTR
jgi:hypothetical protein